MNRLDIKPLSVNEAFYGQRVKTAKYRTYQKEVLLRLKPMKLGSGKLSLSIHFGFSSKGSDIDNCVKQFTDCLSKKYGFNDNRIYRLEVTKEIVPKGQEFIEYSISDLI
jgi:Holliday junction resolvase RusA-like endonuclease